MGLLSSVGIGIGAAANAAQPYIINMQQAEIQKLRDDRMAEIAKGSAKYAADLEIEYAPKKQAALATGLIDLEKSKAKLWDDPEYSSARAREEEITNPDRGAELRSEQTKAAKLSNEQAQMLVNKRNEWMNEPNQVKKAKLGEEYQALTGKDPDKFAPIMGKDEVTGAPIFLGSFDTKNNRFTSVSELSGGSKPESGLPKISTYEEYQALPKGTTYIAPDGQTRTKK